MTIAFFASAPHTLSVINTNVAKIVLMIVALLKAGRVPEQALAQLILRHPWRRLFAPLDMILRESIEIDTFRKLDDPFHGC
jgi:hypothetical protein